MRSRHFVFVVVASLSFAALDCQVVRAQGLFYGNSGFDGGYGGYGGYGGLWNQSLFGVSGSLYGSGYLPVPPYFSIHPPVYYSHQIIYRPMGDSPFAYAPRRPQASASASAHVAPQDVEPMMIENPYVEVAGDTTSTRTTPVARSQPKLILNPFVELHPANSEVQVARFKRGDGKN